MSSLEPLPGWTRRHKCKQLEPAVVNGSVHTAHCLRVRSKDLGANLLASSVNWILNGRYVASPGLWPERETRCFTQTYPSQFVKVENNKLGMHSNQEKNWLKTRTYTHTQPCELCFRSRIYEGGTQSKMFKVWTEKRRVLFGSSLQPMLKKPV